MTGSTKIGAADISKLVASVVSIPAAGIGPAFSFERAAGRAIDQLHQACNGIALPVAVPTCVTYVFCDDLESAVKGHNFDPISLVWTTDTSITLAEIENRIVLISRNGGAGCRSQTVFTKMSDHAAALAAMGLGNSGCLIFQLQSSVVTLYHFGILGNSNEQRPFGTVSQLLIGKKLEETLDHFDDTWVNAPLGHAIIWSKQKSKTHVPAKDTERLIQDQMQLALRMADTGTLVVREIPNSEGRADLLLYSDTPGGRHMVILELKVLRSFSYPLKRTDGKLSPVANSANEQSALEVVKQAHRYRKQLSAHRGCARLYDMRKTPAEASPRTKAHKLATALSVELWISDVQFDAQDKRDAKVEAEIAALIASIPDDGD